MGGAAQGGGAPGQAQAGAQALGEYGRLVVAAPGQLARVQRHGHYQVEVGRQARLAQLGAVQLAQRHAHLALALVLELVQQMLHAAVPQETQVAQGVLDGQLAPEAAAQRVLLGRQAVEVGVGQLGAAAGAEVGFAARQRLSAGQAHAGENQPDKIVGQGAEHTFEGW